MDAQTVIGIIGAAISLGGATTGYIITIRKHQHEMKIQKEQRAKEEQARINAEKKEFYLTTAANLVVSADKLELTGPQKKEYVMTWLENEAIKAGIEVDKAAMSASIERTILVLNDFKDKGQPVSEILQETLDESIERERLLIESSTEQALKNLDIDTKQLHKQVGNTVKSGQDTLANVEKLLK